MADQIDECPEGYAYTKDHEWVRRETDGTVSVGITAFAQSELGELVFVELPPVGKQIKKGETLCVVESTKAASDVYAPLSGVVTAINEDLQQNPSLINNDSYGKGWIAKIKTSEESEQALLLTPEQYRATIKH